MKPKAWSFSALDTFKTCPRQYEAKYVSKSVQEEKSEQMLWGERVHKAFELRQLDGTPLPAGLERRYRGRLRRLCPAQDPLRAAGADIGSKPAQPLRQPLLQLDWALIITPLLLAATGVLLVFSASYPQGLANGVLGLQTTSASDPWIASESPQYLATLKAKLAASGLRVIQGRLRTREDADFAAAATDIRRQIDRARELGIGTLINTGTGKAALYDAWYRCMALAAAYGAEHGKIGRAHV